jgi:hypothetical protein
LKPRSLGEGLVVLLVLSSNGIQRDGNLDEMQVSEVEDGRSLHVHGRSIRPRLRLLKRVSDGLQSASSRSVPCHVNLVYLHAVLSLGVHATCACRKVRPQGNMHLFPGAARGFACLACINAMHGPTRRLKR